MNETIDTNELDADAALIQAIDIIGDKRNGIVHAFGRIFQYYDEPKFFQYYARVADPALKLHGDYGTAGGFSFLSKKTAALKCLAEALERYALENTDSASITFAPASRLQKKYLDPRDVVSFSDGQRQLRPELRLDPAGPFGWVLGKEISSNEDIYIPAQLVYLLYKRQIGESIVRMPISTGAAAGTSLSAAIYRGMCEIIERDAFMITYLNKLQRIPVAINNPRNPAMKLIAQMAKNYNIDLRLFDISTDLEMYTFLAVAVDTTGIGAAISTGLKSSLDPMEAMIGALHEVFHPRTWIRREKENFDGADDLSAPLSLSQRGLLWARKEAIEQLDFLLQNKRKPISVESYQNRSKGSTQKDLTYMATVLDEMDYHTYYVDITPKNGGIAKSSFKVAMVIIPELHPLYLDERFRYLGGNRIYDVPVKLGYLDKAHGEHELNAFPHPFL